MRKEIYEHMPDGGSYFCLTDHGDGERLDLIVDSGNATAITISRESAIRMAVSIMNEYCKSEPPHTGRRPVKLAEFVESLGEPVRSYESTFSAVDVLKEMFGLPTPAASPEHTPCLGISAMEIIGDGPRLS